MGRPSAAESIITTQEIRFEDRFQDQERRHLHHPVPNCRNPQWSQFSIGFLDPYSTYRLRLVGLLLQRLLDLIQKSSNSAFAFFDHRDRHAIDTGRSLIGFHPSPCRFQCVAPIDPVVQNIKPKLRLLPRFPVQLLSQFREFPRHAHLRPNFRCLKLPCRFFRSGILIQAVLFSSYSCTFTFSPFAPR
jgi:hypothetical protein